MHVLLWILLAAIVNSLMGFVGVITLLIGEKHMAWLVKMLIAFSAGTLLGGAFFHLLAEGIERVEPLWAMGYAVIGFMMFYLIEGYFHWHRCEHCEHPFTYTMLIGDAVHNVIDGMVIAASFIVNVPLGIVTTIVILSHEAPQEMGLFAVLLYGRHRKGKALLYSALAQSSCLLGGLLGYFLATDALTNFLVPFAAGGFIYIAASDLVPEMHRMHDGSLMNAVKVLVPFIIGVLLMIGTKILFE